MSTWTICPGDLLPIHRLYPTYWRGSDRIVIKGDTGRIVAIDRAYTPEAFSRPCLLRQRRYRRTLFDPWR